MNQKTTYALFVTLLALLGAAGLILLSGNRPTDQTLLLPGPRALKLQAKDFDAVTIESTAPNAQTLVFRRVDDKRWKLEKPVDARADAAAVERIIDDVLGASRDGKTEPSKNLAEYDLTNPSVTVTLGRKDGSKYSIGLGSVSVGNANAQVFATSSERAGLAMPVRRGALTSFLKGDGEAKVACEIVKTIGDFRSKELLLEGAGFNAAENVTSVRVTDGKTEVALARTAEGGWKFEKPAEFGAAESKGAAGAAAGPGGPDAGIEGLIAALAAIKPASADDLIDATTELDKLGLNKDKPAGPTITVTRKTADGQLRSETLYVGAKDDATNKVHVRLDGESTVARVAVGLLDPVNKLLARPAALRDRQLLAFNPTDCDAVDIRLPGESAPVELRKLGSPAAWKLLDADGKEQSAYASAVSEMLAALSGKPVKDFPEPGTADAVLGFDRPAAEIALYVGGILPPDSPEAKKEDAAKNKDKADSEKAKDADKSQSEPAKVEPKPAVKPKMKEPTARLIVGRRDKDLLYVRRILKDKDGKETTADFALSETLRDKLTRGRLEFVDPTLPSFIPADVIRLTFRRGVDEYEIERQSGKQPEWIIRKPADRADRGADPVKVESLLGELARLTPTRLWSERPGDRELERYGLKTPKFQATVTTREGDKTRERFYFFGSETDDKTGVYARQGDRDLVFVVGRNAVPSLESGELQDPVVFRLDAGRVTGIKLTGWKDVVGAVTVRHLERKGASNWALQGDDKIRLSVGQCEALLNALSMVRAERFVVHRTGPRPEHKLDIAAGALQIEIFLDGEKDPVTLTIGAADADGKAFHATSSRLPGDVFLLPKGLFETVKAKPGFFAAD